MMPAVLQGCPGVKNKKKGWGHFHVVDSNIRKTNIPNNSSQEEEKTSLLIKVDLFLFSKLGFETENGLHGTEFTIKINLKKY